VLPCQKPNRYFGEDSSLNARSPHPLRPECRGQIQIKDGTGCCEHIMVSGDMCFSTPGTTTKENDNGDALKQKGISCELAELFSTEEQATTLKPSLR
jgi:hypothetical protein